jgi:hypothetical protein
MRIAEEETVIKKTTRIGTLVIKITEVAAPIGVQQNRRADISAMTTVVQIMEVVICIVQVAMADIMKVISTLAVSEAIEVQDTLHTMEQMPEPVWVQQAAATGLEVPATVMEHKAIIPEANTDPEAAQVNIPVQVMEAVQVTVAVHSGTRTEVFTTAITRAWAAADIQIVEAA